MTRRLEGIGVAVTRAGASPGRLGHELAAAGARVTHWPSIRFAPPEDESALVGAAARRREFDWLVLTSPRAASVWLEVAAPLGDREPRIAVAGPATAGVLRAAGLDVVRIAEPRSAHGVLLSFSEAADASGASILLPQSDRASPKLATGLADLGARVTTVVAYRTVSCSPHPHVVLEAAGDGTVQVVTFTSPSTVEGFLGRADADQAARIIGALRAAAIGPTTARALADRGWTASVAADASVEGLLGAVEAADSGAAGVADGGAAGGVDGGAAGGVDGAGDKVDGARTDFAHHSPMTYEEE